MPVMLQRVAHIPWSKGMETRKKLAKLQNHNKEVLELSSFEETINDQKERAITLVKIKKLSKIEVNEILFSILYNAQGIKSTS